MPTASWKIVRKTIKKQLFLKKIIQLSSYLFWQQGTGMSFYPFKRWIIDTSNGFCIHINNKILLKNYSLFFL